MARLYRPHIPLSVKIAVAERQAKERPSLSLGAYLAADWRGNKDGQLKMILAVLARHMGCTVAELRLDHDPPLALRKRTGEGRRTVYDPPANDPNYMSYRPHGAQHDGSHDVKTRVRGDHGQHSDLALIRIAKRRARREATSVSGFKNRKQKMKSRSAWPPKGSRKIPNRRRR